MTRLKQGTKMTQAKKISKGDKFVCTLKRLSKPLIGTVIALTNEPGKKIGLEFEEDVKGHSCDGRGKDGHCLWASQYDILTKEEYEASLKVTEEAKKIVYSEMDSITLD